MALPNFKEEKKLWKKGYSLVAGLDEAGRGPLAGPVIATAVAITGPEFPISLDAKRTPRRVAFEIIEFSGQTENSINRRLPYGAHINHN